MPTGDLAASVERPTVVLLHGLARTPDSMAELAKALEAAEYRVCNIPYPSRDHGVRTLAVEHVAPAVQACVSESTRPVHFVTHSLGGILVRQLEALDAHPRIGRVVMLGPPNQGSEVVDKLGELGLFEFINGPAGGELGTEAGSAPNRLGPPRFEFGVIAGSSTINPLLSMLIPGPDDGKVSVARAKLAGMKDFLVVPASHPFLMQNREAIRQALHFLAHGSFQHAMPAADGD